MWQFVPSYILLRYLLVHICTYVMFQIQIFLLAYTRYSEYTENDKFSNEQCGPVLIQLHQKKLFQTTVNILPMIFGQYVLSMNLLYYNKMDIMILIYYGIINAIIFTSIRTSKSSLL